MRRNTTLATIHRTSRRNPDDRGEPGGRTAGKEAHFEEWNSINGTDEEG